MDADIPIRYSNKTGCYEVKVVIFTRNKVMGESSPVAWKVLQGDKEAEFFYPAQVQVGATYESGGVTHSLGPDPASLGSVWTITQTSPDACPVLAQEKSNPAEGGTIAMKNVQSAWPGRDYDMGLYKDDYLLMVARTVRPGMEAVFGLPSQLYFAVSKHGIRAGETFNFGQVMFETLVDFRTYPKGVEVTLETTQNGGYKFTPTVL